jgi:aspartyl-tRNA(Asn)/glutamyl-tRNA(Gln) amidotransferase subunit B
MKEEIPYDLWEPVIGLEVHVQLNTKTKLFSHAANKFGEEPNTNITPVCTGQPGALPLLNSEAVKKAVQFGLAINADISHFSTFERKSYFYPDTPRNFQITQFEHPIISGGTIISEIDGEVIKFSVNRAHLEDDAGMLKHFSSFAGVDFNRAGAPLLEVVSEPVIHTPKEAVSYVTSLKAIMEYIGASDCNMEEGSLRVDANISVRPKGSCKLRNKIEVKNMNSFTSLSLAIESEIRRQIELYTDNPNDDINSIIYPGTYRWDAERKANILMRRKETADDYRYFPEPDLPPIVLSENFIADIKTTLPELPYERYKRYIKDYNLSEYSSSILTNEKDLADYFEEGLKTTTNARSLCNWITVEFTGRLKEKGETLLSLGITCNNIAKLVNMIDDGVITGKMAKKVADDMVLQPGTDSEEIVKNNPNYRPMDNDTIIPIIDKVIEENPQSINDFKAGKKKAFAFLIGQIMKLSHGKADPQFVSDTLRKKIEDRS